MERIKRINNDCNTYFTYPIKEEPIVLSMSLLNLLLNEPDPATLIALYVFYYYTAKWQRTNQPKATDKYCMDGLAIGYTKLHQAQETLIRLGLIEKFCNRDSAGRIKNWYIKINFIWKNDTINKKLAENNPAITGNLPAKTTNSPELSKTRSGFQSTNALSDNIINALSEITLSETKISDGVSEIKKKKEKEPDTITLNKKQRAMAFVPLANRLSDIIKTKKNIKHTTQQIHSWAYDICRLVEDNGVSKERIEKALSWYEKNIGGEYIPVIESGSSLRNKFINVEAAMGRTPSPKSKQYIDDYGDRYYLDAKTGNYYNREGKLYR